MWLLAAADIDYSHLENENIQMKTKTFTVYLGYVAKTRHQHVYIFAQSCFSKTILIPEQQW